MRKLVNLTPHDIKVETLNGDVLTIPPSGGIIPRVEVDNPPHGVLMTGSHAIQLVGRELVDVHDLPPPSDKEVYIVSSMVLEYLKQRGVKRDDIVAPDTGGTAKRDANRRIEMVRRFISLA